MERERVDIWSADFEHALQESGLIDNLERCLACGKCVGACPVAAVSPTYNPRQIIRDTLMGKAERIIASEEIWRCFWCAGCYTVCPSEIKFPLLMLVLRDYALRHGSGKKYVSRLKRFVEKAREDGVTFLPGKPEKLAKIKALRASIGLAPLRKVSPAAIGEYQLLYQLSGTVDYLKQLEQSQESEIKLSYEQGKILPDASDDVRTEALNLLSRAVKKVPLVDKERLAKVPTPEKMFLFQSCTGSIEYPGTEKAVKAVAAKLGIEMIESADQTCCTGYMLTCNALNPMLALTATARNMSIAEELGLDVAVFCNGCYGYLSELTHMLNTKPAIRAEVDGILKQLNRRYQGTSGIYHVQELWYKQLAKITQLVQKPLKGLKVAAHYGCHYLANREAAIDISSDPTFMEEIIERLGGTPVVYKERRACCGYSVGRGFTHREEVVIPHIAKKMSSAVEDGVELMVTVCPGCNVALDREQPQLNEMGINSHIAVIDLSQLIAFALGVPFEQLGFDANTTPVKPILAKFL